LVQPGIQPIEIHLTSTHQHTNTSTQKEWSK
jgi:hypothetical protein